MDEDSQLIETHHDNIEVAADPNQWQQEMLLRRYEHLNTMYRFYMDFVLKAIFFNYGIAGSIVAFYLAHTDQPQIRWALALPLLISLYFLMLFGRGAGLWTIKADEAVAIGKRLKAQYSETGAAPLDSLYLLSFTLASYAVILAITCVALIALLLEWIPLTAMN